MIKIVGVLNEEGKNGYTEDALVTNEKNCRFAVIDGESGFGPFSGATAAATLRRFLLDKTYENDSLEHILRSANMEMRRAKIGYTIWNDFGEIEKHARNYCSVAAIQVRDDKLHYIQAGNCMIFLQYQNNQIRCLTYDHMAKVQEKYIRKTKGSFNRLKKTLRRNYSEKKLKLCYEEAQMLNQNFAMKCCESHNTYEGYGIIDGSREAPNFWETGCIPLMDIKKIALVTDGLQSLSHKPPGQDRWDEMSKKIFSRGLKSVYTKISAMEKDDPYCQQYPRIQPSDDKMGILLEVLRS